MVEGPGGDRQSESKSITDNISNGLVDHGTSKAYTVSRLKRDRPDLFEKVVAGELSANKAAIEAQEANNDFKRLANSTQPTIPATSCD